MNEIRRVALYGVGLIGGSLGLALRALPDPPEVVGIHTSRASARAAMEKGAVDRGTTDLAEGLAGVDLLIVCSPVSTIVPLIVRAIPYLSPGSIVTDVGSTKSEIVREAEAVLPPEIHFIGGHPLTGSELTGVQNATATLFANCYYILTPTDRTQTWVYERLHALLASLGAKVVALGPEEHDRTLAVISHLPHMLSAALVNLAEEERGETENLLMLTAGGFRDMTRIAASSPQVWVDVCLTNRDAILGSARRFSGRLAAFTSALERGDEDELRRLFTAARDVRQNLPGILPAAAEKISRLRVVIPDRPGVISEITRAIGRRGINIDDLQMIHLAPGERALLELTISDRDRAEEAAGALRVTGFELQLVAGEVE